MAELQDTDSLETYEDAQEYIYSLSDDAVGLERGIMEAQAALDLFLNNHFHEARSRMQPWAHQSMYHALSYATVLYIQAVMTFDMTDIDVAITATKQAVIVCNKLRRKTSLIGSITKATTTVNYNDYTEEEIHAELCYAECLLIRALLTFIQDENLISFVRGGLKIRECYQCYKECHKILERRAWTDETQRRHFESGVRMGIGAFNLMISLLPGKILRLLEFVGFSGNKQLGLCELAKGSEMFDSLRGPLCCIILIAYHSLVSYILGVGDGDINYASQLLVPCLHKFPKGALFLFYSGRIEEIRANIDEICISSDQEEAILRLEESIDSQQEWRQFHHLCFWELMFCHSFKGDWLMAMKYAERLCKESRWSKATYMYQKASFLMMCDEGTDDTVTHTAYLMGEVPKLKQRIAGKSVPIEKFAVKKAQRFVEQNGYLTLPALELLYVWNGFTTMGRRSQLLDPMLSLIESTVNEITSNKDSYIYYYDDYSLALLLKGVCLKFKGQLFQAEMCFTEVINNHKMIIHDTYLVPYAMVELALLHMQQHMYDKVKPLITKAKKGHQHYLLESRLHFRIHAIKSQLSLVLASDQQTTSDTPCDGSSVSSMYRSTEEYRSSTCSANTDSNSEYTIAESGLSE